jgi:retron-type reverse transcriptase
MDAAVEILRDYPDKCGYSLQDFRQLVIETEWQGPEAIDGLRRKLRKRALQGISSWRSLPGQFDCSLQVAVRNLIACSRKADLPVYRILLRFEDKNSKSSLSDELKDVLKVLPRTDKELSLFETLVLSDRIPGPAAFTAILADDPRKLFEAGIWLNLSGSRATVARLATTIDAAFKGLSNEHSDVCVKALEDLVRRHRWPRFVSPDFVEAQSKTFRQALFRADKLHTKSLQTKLRKDPAYHPDTPAALNRRVTLQNALVAIGSNDMSWSDVVDLAEDQAFFLDNQSRIRTAIGREPRRWEEPALGTARLKKALQKYEDVPEAAALQLLAHGPSVRHSVLKRFPQRIAEVALGMLDGGAVTETLAATKTVQGRALVLDLIKEPETRKDVLARCFTNQYKPWPIEHHDLLAAWFRIGEVRELKRTVALDESTILSFAKVADGDPKFLTLLSKVQSQLGGRVIFSLLSPSNRKALLGVDSTEAEATIEQMVSRLQSPGVIDDWHNRKRFASVARWFPEVGAIVLARRPSDWAFSIVATMPGVWKLDQAVLQKLLRLKDDNGKPLWVKMLRRRKLQNKVAAGFKRFVAANPKTLRQGFEVAPTVFWPYVRADYSLRQLLPAALRYPKLAIELEKRFLREKIRSELPWIRKNWKDRPTLAAAYEIAAAFSLADAGYLVRLGSRLKPTNPEQQGTAFDDFYRTYELPKQAGGTRTITVPAKPLRRLQRRILSNGLDEIPLHAAAMGFRKGRSIRDNAAQHVNKALVVNVDIRQFFPNTGYPLILRASRQLLGSDISPRAARLVAELCSYKGALPTGAPTSPAIANIVLTPADGAIGKVAEQRGISYTRYADDLTFSGEDGVLKILPFVRDVLEQLGYQIDAKKTNIYRRGRRQLVTGLVVNEQPNMPRRQRRELRAAVHHRISGKQPHWHGKPISDHVLLGYLAFLQLTQPEEAKTYRKLLVGVMGK